MSNLAFDYVRKGAYRRFRKQAGQLTPSELELLAMSIRDKKTPLQKLLFPDDTSPLVSTIELRAMHVGSFVGKGVFHKGAGVEVTTAHSHLFDTFLRRHSAARWVNPWTHQQEVFPWRDWLLQLAANSFPVPTKTDFGRTMTLSEVLLSLLALPERIDVVERAASNLPVSDELTLSPTTPVMPTAKGWQFLAGTPLAAHIEQWRAAGASEDTLATIANGWLPTRFLGLAPGYFHDYDELVENLWDTEVTSLLQCEAASQESRDRLSRSFLINFQNKVLAMLSAFS